MVSSIGVSAVVIAGAVISRDDYIYYRYGQFRSPQPTDASATIVGVEDTGRLWDAIWHGHTPDELSWFQASPQPSLGLITSVATSPEVPVIDVGGGSSSLVDELLSDGFEHVTVLDVSRAALEIARRRLGAAAARVDWVVADVLTYDFEASFGVWHDRAVLHFLTDAGQQRRYVQQLTGALMSGGHVVLGTFGPHGPTTCSGLPVHRYDEAAMTALLGTDFELRSYCEDVHRAPAGAEQEFAFGVFRRG